MWRLLTASINLTTLPSNPSMTSTALGRKPRLCARQPLHILTIEERQEFAMKFNFRLKPVHDVPAGGLSLFIGPEAPFTLPPKQKQYSKYNAPKAYHT
jgi:hypothetical protein